MIIFRPQDRIPLKIADITIWISPLTLDQRRKISASSKMDGGKEVVDGLAAAILYIKFSIKQIDNLQLADGTPYQLEFDEDGTLKDEVAQELFQLDCSAKIITACGKLAAEIKEHNIEGVTIDLKSVRAAKKK